MEQAIFGAGCFWGVEEAFRTFKGGLATEVGYSGGRTKDPTYEDVCSGKTEHVEVVRVQFDPAKVSYGELLELFWSIHDPTTVNRQGPDLGSQYRSAVFYLNDAQKITAEKKLEDLEKSHVFERPIVTEISSAKPFYRAEDYHQQYLAKRGLGPRCH